MSSEWDIDWSEGVPMMIGPFQVGQTETSPETAGYWEGVHRGELMIKYCSACDVHLYPRRIFCPDCMSEDLEWVKATGEGNVYSFSTIYRAPLPELEVPYTNGIVKLVEGVYMFGRLVGKPDEEIAVDDPVKVRFEQVVEGQLKLAVYEVLTS